jgi:hypothetical protein
MERVENRILSIRGYRVMLDADLAVLYGVTTGALNQAVKRNAERFPGDFMFRLTAEEGANLKSQIVISNGWGGRRRSLPLAFTEQGVAMLSGVLNSSRAIQANVAIMRAFVRCPGTSFLTTLGDMHTVEEKPEVVANMGQTWGLTPQRNAPTLNP